MDKIDEKMVRHIASLARIDLDSSEINPHKEHLGRILQYVDQLKEVETNDITEISPDKDTSYRDDRILPSLPVEAILRNAPASRSGQFKVDGVLENE